ncbi:hypothetical protein FOQG_19394 [Fusarium oxysporum f. sp. raphani 54005]|uniref:Uncharacterized protein n=1 Tax=Fusarium oxysporum f. sp. raphani 54005 TaxID=1089458 RepID=X0BZ77_FUSOX|nr:hypothetical protein FOQG_19394 [Fusarium oxysporum f. sp. raphani 54005]
MATPWPQDEIWPTDYREHATNLSKYLQRHCQPSTTEMVCLSHPVEFELHLLELSPSSSKCRAHPILVTFTKP